MQWKSDKPFYILKEDQSYLVRPKVFYKYGIEGKECKERLINLLKMIIPEDLLLFYFLSSTKNIRIKEEVDSFNIRFEFFSDNNNSSTNNTRKLALSKLNKDINMVNLRLKITLKIEKLIEKNKIKYTILHNLNILEDFKYKNIIKKTFQFKIVDTTNTSLIENLKLIKRLSGINSKNLDKIDLNIKALLPLGMEVKDIEKFIINYIVTHGFNKLGENNKRFKNLNKKKLKTTGISGTESLSESGRCGGENRGDVTKLIKNNKIGKIDSKRSFHTWSNAQYNFLDLDLSQNIIFNFKEQKSFRSRIGGGKIYFSSSTINNNRINKNEIEESQDIFLNSCNPKDLIEGDNNSINDFAGFEYTVEGLEISKNKIRSILERPLFSEIFEGFLRLNIKEISLLNFTIEIDTEDKANLSRMFIFKYISKSLKYKIVIQIQNKNNLPREPHYKFIYTFLFYINKNNTWVFKERKIFGETHILYKLNELDHFFNHSNFNKTEIEKIWDFPGEFIIRGVFKESYNKKGQNNLRLNRIILLGKIDYFKE